MISPSPNTIVIYTTDNSAETLARRWCHALPGRKEYQLGGRLPCPGDDAGPRVVPPRTEINEIFSAEDWATTLVAAAGEPAIKEKLLQGYDATGKNFKVHLDGYDQRDLLAGKGPDKRDVKNPGCTL
jgi:arylsulfatase A-like enzyme